MKLNYVQRNQLISLVISICCSILVFFQNLTSQTDKIKFKSKMFCKNVNLRTTEVVVICKVYVLGVGGRISWWGVEFTRKLFPPGGRISQEILPRGQDFLGNHSPRGGGFPGGRISWYTGSNIHTDLAIQMTWCKLCNVTAL